MKTSWSKILFVASDVVIAAYIAFAFFSFDKNGDSKARCSKVDIEIADNAVGGFLDARVIKERLEKSGLYPIGKPLPEVNARGIEETLRQSPFVKTAECYKTEGGHVYISVTQRMPVIRIKADNGDDYYVDDNDCIMPRTNYTSDLIVATGCISRIYAINYISPLGKAIMQNDLWKNLIEQVNVLPDMGVELVPRIGGHIVYIGRLPDGTDRKRHAEDIAGFLDKKMTRLEKFYKYGLSQVGWNKYSYVNIEFDNQIICRRKGENCVAAVQEDASQLSAPTHPEDGPSEGEAETPVTPTGDRRADAQGGQTPERQAAPHAENSADKPATMEKTGRDAVKKEHSGEGKTAKGLDKNLNRKKTSNKEKNNT